MKLIACGPAQAAEIQAIINPVIADTTSSYEEKPRTLEDIHAWLEGKRRDGFPVLGLTDDGGRLAGYGTLGPFRPQAAYRHTVEHSLYVAPAFRGRGIGRRLLDLLIGESAARGCHLMIGVIDSANTASIRLHEQAGFSVAGRLAQAGRKFDRWLDVVFLHKVLSPEECRPAFPEDG